MVWLSTFLSGQVFTTEDIGVDFYCAEAQLIVELDGSQHYEDKGMEYDAERTAYLEQYGVRVLRIPNNEVSRNFSGVCEYIDFAVKQSLHR